MTMVSKIMVSNKMVSNTMYLQKVLTKIMVK